MWCQGRSYSGKYHPGTTFQHLIQNGVLSFLLLTGCVRVSEELEPQINSSVQDRYLKSLPTPFLSLTPQELQEPWAKEVLVGMGFANELDLYQAMTAFKRASFLLPSADHLDNQVRKTQMDYETLLAYYLGGKYSEVIYTFNSTSLQMTDPQFPPYHDLLVMLYDSHLHLARSSQAHNSPTDALMRYMTYQYPETAQRLFLSKMLFKGDIRALQEQGSSYPEIQTMLHNYYLEKKSLKTAQMLNAVIPGAGYFYIGQRQSAITALLLNGLFIWASAYFFQHGNTAAGIIFTSLETGWYFGGIYGAGQEAKLYNERVYEKYATPLMNEYRYFPILMLKYGF